MGSRGSRSSPATAATTRPQDDAQDHSDGRVGVVRIGTASASSGQIDMGPGSRITTQRHRKVTLPPGYSQLHWMRLTQSGADLSGLGRGAPPRKGISMREVRAHQREDDLWGVLDGRVYNLTRYVPFHPGGVQTLMMAAGGDYTALFNEYHAWVNAHSMLERCFIGTLDPDSLDDDDEATAEATAKAATSSSSASTVALDPIAWRPFRLMARTPVGPTTVKFTFELPPKKRLGLMVPGQHLKVRARVDGQWIERQYTPTTKLGQFGSFDLLIKLYPDGRLSRWLDTNLSVGATLEMQGPHGLIGYPAPRTITHGREVVHREADELHLIAAGTGITPMLQLIRAVFERGEDATTTITLIYVSRCLDEVLAREQLEPLANLFPQRLRLHHVLGRASPEDAKELGHFTIGRLEPTLLGELLPPVGPHVAAFHCGPPAFDEWVGGFLRDQGYAPHQIHLF